MERSTHSWRDANEPRHHRVRHRGKGSRHRRNEYLPLRRRWPVGSLSREPAKNGLQKRPVHGRRFQGLESGRATDDEIIDESKNAWAERGVTRHLHPGRHVTTSYALLSLRLCSFACVLLNIAQITGVFAADLKDNPLAAESVLPYQYPPFD